MLICISFGGGLKGEEERRLYSYMENNRKVWDHVMMAVSPVYQAMVSSKSTLENVSLFKSLEAWQEQQDLFNHGNRVSQRLLHNLNSFWLLTEFDIMIICRLSVQLTFDYSLITFSLSLSLSLSPPQDSHPSFSLSTHYITLLST